ncbi:hypothetical protein BDI4_660014 [Burkholderia diffusa]|uniref:hypothetical protein n=1 Tax=Burkholderia diffusa TaxID=488732 RepID=UPI001CAB8025|nr:hypothetical protein [Burkholderia diffusa]CAG9260875.1 hypothetical protein BDI4_660014 [Burkholderia diffusa]
MILTKKSLLNMIIPGSTRSVTSLVRQAGVDRKSVTKLLTELVEQAAIEFVFSGRQTSVRRPSAGVADPVLCVCPTPTTGIFSSTLNEYDVVMRRQAELSMLVRRQ